MVRIFARRLIAVLVALLLAGPADAQLDPGNFDLVQNGRVVGEIFVPERGAGATRYVEHWVLFPSYAYPSPDSRLRTRIRRRRQRDGDEAAFFARVSFPAGARYVRIDATEFDTLPTP